ncbi:L-tyrosine/L-tryptophan isonitrile synthase family protein, partial [Nocardia brasiliensis]|uniref:L-tyrosine/L-tryptophan isonitrile synthase family protein n=1 Tax=Nocardia brasiliensis TaxID=37326 RepID=UPI002454A640
MTTTTAAGALRETTLSPADHAVAERILRIVFRRRRTAEPADPCATKPCPDCFAPHLETVGQFIAANKPIHFVIPAFPAKSRNRRKTIGRLPDLGEQIALESVQGFCEQVSAVYKPGAVVTVCSDGHVFSDVLGIPDEHIDDYGHELMRMIRSIGGGAIGLYGLRDAMPDLSWDERRARLLAEYSESIAENREWVRTDPAPRPQRQCLKPIEPHRHARHGFRLVHGQAGRRAVATRGRGRGGLPAHRRELDRGDGAPSH